MHDRLANRENPERACPMTSGEERCEEILGAEDGEWWGGPVPLRRCTSGERIYVVPPLRRERRAGLPQYLWSVVVDLAIESRGYGGYGDRF
jgi:hypothetical protein